MVGEVYDYYFEWVGSSIEIYTIFAPPINHLAARASL